MIEPNAHTRFCFPGCRPNWKLPHYFEIYARHFQPFVGQAVTVLEIGVGPGGSLQMWRHFLGPLAEVHGIDANPATFFEEERIHVHLGPVRDAAFVARIRAEIARPDIIIDDGSHFAVDQMAAFRAFYPVLSPRGVYVCEDLCTSYWRHYGGGTKQPGTFIEHVKDMLDQIHAWFCCDGSLAITPFTQSTYALHCYPGIAVIEKRPMSEALAQRFAESLRAAHQPADVAATDRRNVPDPTDFQQFYYGVAPDDPQILSPGVVGTCGPRLPLPPLEQAEQERLADAATPN